MRIKLLSSVSVKANWGESVMLDKAGNVYPTIDGMYHPPASTGEIERTADWLCQYIKPPLFNKFRETIMDWLRIRYANIWFDEPDVIDDRAAFMNALLYTDKHSEELWQLVQEVAVIADDLDDKQIEEMGQQDENGVDEFLVHLVNEQFLRVRAGGKLNPEPENNTVYFRISSRGFNWRPVIEQYMWDTFNSPENMPSGMWIGTDKESRGEEIIYFDGDPRDYFSANDWYDMKVFSSAQEKANAYRSRMNPIANKTRIESHCSKIIASAKAKLQFK